MRCGTPGVRSSLYLLASLYVSIERSMEVKMKYFLFRNVKKGLSKEKSRYVNRCKENMQHLQRALNYKWVAVEKNSVCTDI
jgi:hypothetical protein